MRLYVEKEVAALRRMTVGELRQRYQAAFGDSTRSQHKQWLIKRIAWKLQANAEGDISERARRLAAELAQQVDIRTSAPNARSPVSHAGGQHVSTTMANGIDKRLPPPGTILVRPYKGQSIQVKVLSRGFEYEGEIYKSLSAVAKQVTGQHCNGFLFFNLCGTGANP